MATLTKYKTQNQLFSDFLTVAESGLNNFGINNWKFRQLNQIYKINVLEPTVFVSIITNPQNGSQYRTKKQGVTTNSTKNEVQIRFSALRRELQNDDENTMNATDALRLIREYIQSEDGIEQLSTLGYAQYRSTAVQEQSFLNDSDNFQFLPFFDCTFLYTNSWNNAVNQISKVKIKGIYKI